MVKDPNSLLSSIEKYSCWTDNVRNLATWHVFAWKWLRCYKILACYQVTCSCTVLLEYFMISSVLFWLRIKSVSENAEILSMYFSNHIFQCLLYFLCISCSMLSNICKSPHLFYQLILLYESPHFFFLLWWCNLTFFLPCFLSERSFRIPLLTLTVLPSLDSPLSLTLHLLGLQSHCWSSTLLSCPTSSSPIVTASNTKPIFSSSHTYFEACSSCWCLQLVSCQTRLCHFFFFFCKS